MQVLENNVEFKPFMPMTLEPFEMEFKCEKHGLMQITAMKDKSGNVVGACCPECEKEREAAEKAEQERLAAERAENKRIEIFAAMNVEPEFYDKTLDDYKPKTQKQAEFKKAIETLIETKKGKVIVLGKNGTGKSMLGAVAAKALGGVVYTVFQLSLKIRSLDKKDMSEWQFANSLIDAPLLVIDEVGRSKGSEFELNLLSYILDKRHTRGKPFVILSNTHFSRECPNGKKGCDKCFERYFDNDLLSRFRQDGKFIEFEESAPDWRDPRNKKLWEEK